MAERECNPLLQSHAKLSSELRRPWQRQKNNFFLGLAQYSQDQKAHFLPLLIVVENGGSDCGSDLIGLLQPNCVRHLSWKKKDKFCFHFFFKIAMYVALISFVRESGTIPRQRFSGAHIS